MPHARTGKIIVASEHQEIAALEALLARGQANGVEGLALVDSAFVAAREPHVHAVAALYSPESGIVDAEELVKTLLRQGEAAGVIFLPGTRLLGADRAERRRWRSEPSVKRSWRARSSTPPGSMRTTSRGCSEAKPSRSIRVGANTRSSRPRNGTW